ncbi:hypothetical protein NUW58_g5585 [Xylaria curta]|uniref:Uncharacterized protein n=1 Tax=Xylaria curta TaxID=42375 RepID=A0ACC1P0W8_9PEZI|nr:hypothetical protein NUW58_g5585 [Xylaria curta]
MAASTTAPASFYPYSCQSSFLRPVMVKAHDRVAYHVERTADGRNSATRLVRAVHGNNPQVMYIAIISFQGAMARLRNVLSYGPPMPDLDSLRPDDIGKELMGPEEDPFDWRPFGFVLTENPRECRTREFSRSPSLSTRSAPVHMAALAFMSDQILLGVALYANPEKVGSRMQNVTMCATLNHTMAFHDPELKMDDWVVAERETSWGDEGRVLIHQRIWNLESGRLVMTCSQEVMVRLKAPVEKL